MTVDEQLTEKLHEMQRQHPCFSASKLEQMIRRTPEQCLRNCKWPATCPRLVICQAEHLQRIMGTSDQPEP